MGCFRSLGIQDAIFSKITKKLIEKPADKMDSFIGNMLTLSDLNVSRSGRNVKTRATGIPLGQRSQRLDTISIVNVMQSDIA